MSKAKKILNISLNIVSWLLVAVTVFLMLFTIVTVKTVDKNDRSFLGLRFYIVQSDSMSKSENNKDMRVHFNKGDIVMVKKVKDPTSLEAGDIISFMSTNPDASYGKTVTHMIRSVERNSKGEVVGYVTFGTHTGSNDMMAVEPSYVLGKYVGKIPRGGDFFEFLQDKERHGFLLCILPPFLLVIIYNVVKIIVLVVKYKNGQTAMVKAEVEAERKQNEDMMRELLALKAQLEQQQQAMTPTEKPAESNNETGENEAMPENTEASEPSENESEDN